MYVHSNPPCHDNDGGEQCTIGRGSTNKRHVVPEERNTSVVERSSGSWVHQSFGSSSLSECDFRDWLPRRLRVAPTLCSALSACVLVIPWPCAPWRKAICTTTYTPSVMFFDLTTSIHLQDRKSQFRNSRLLVPPCSYPMLAPTQIIRLVQIFTTQTALCQHVNMYFLLPNSRE